MEGRERSSRTERLIGAAARMSSDPFLHDIVLELIEQLEAELGGRVGPQWFGSVAVDVTVKSGRAVAMKAGATRSIQL